MRKNLCAGAVAAMLFAMPAISQGAFSDIPCQTCHVWNDCQAPKGECGGCHALPPATGAHAAHFSGFDESLSYGDLRLTQDFVGTQPSVANMIGCGNCHPLHADSHGNGVWGDIELANIAAPPGSIKSLNSSATYAPATGTCSNVYCHSANSWSTEGNVSIPWPAGSLPDNIITTRVYRDVQWDNGTSLGCDGCHDNPPTTMYQDSDGDGVVDPGFNDAGSGDSHNHIGRYGYNSLHVWNMGYEGLSCRSCHFDTVREVSPYTQQTEAPYRRIYQDVPLYDRAKHVNGTVDIVFDTVNGASYQGTLQVFDYPLTAATYDPTTKTCSNIGCHIEETSVVWGTPYRWFVDPDECDRCHQFYISP